MASRRMISSDIFEDDFFISLDLFGRSLWVGLIVKCADDQGRMQDNAILIKSQVFPADEFSAAQVEAALVHFAGACRILRYTSGGKKMIQLLNWWKHQTPQWASKSRYPAPDGWTDREKYHAPGNKIENNNWNHPGGFDVTNPLSNPHANTVTNPINEGDVKGEGDGNSDVKGDGEDTPPPSNDDPFVVLQRTAESVGIMVASPNDSAELTKLVDEGATAADMLAGIAWKKSHNNGKAIRYFSEIIGPTRTAILQRKQASIIPPKRDPIAELMEEFSQ